MTISIWFAAALGVGAVNQPQCLHFSPLSSDRNFEDGRMPNTEEGASDDVTQP
jgi:hypothetical protein